jgi:glycosyltransferase involved in cell wall biosynthesis
MTADRKIRISVLINNYNYCDYLPEAVQSILDQSVAADEIIVVDDSSTDASPFLLQEFMHHPRIKVILKDKNEGQLSCFHEGYKASSGDLIFFLDADDKYEETYLEKTVLFYKDNPECEFLFCGHKIFGDQEDCISPYLRDRDLGYSTISALYAKSWVGGVTSTLSMKRFILDKILPIPYVEEWRTRADDCLVFGASVVGARKFYMHKHLVKYRIHAENRFNGRVFDDNYYYKRSLRVYQLLSFMSHRMHYDDEILKLAWLEFLTIPSPTRKELALYTGIILLSRIHFMRKLKGILSNLRHFLLHHFLLYRGTIK